MGGTIPAEKLIAGDDVLLNWRNSALVAGETNRLPRERFGGAFITASVLLLLAYIVGSGSLRAAGDLLLPGLIGLLFLGGAVFVAARAVRDLRDQARLERHGQLLTGTATGVREHSRTVGYIAFQSIRELTVSYLFLTPAGDERTGETSVLDWTRRVPSTGDRLVVLYADGLDERVM